MRSIEPLAQELRDKEAGRHRSIVTSKLLLVPSWPEGIKPGSIRFLAEVLAFSHLTHYGKLCFHCGESKNYGWFSARAFYKDVRMVLYFKCI